MTQPPQPPQRETSSEHYWTVHCGRCGRFTTEAREVFAGEANPVGDQLWSFYGKWCPECRADFRELLAGRPAQAAEAQAPDEKETAP